LQPELPPLEFKFIIARKAQSNGEVCGTLDITQQTDNNKNTDQTKIGQHTDNHLMTEAELIPDTSRRPAILKHFFFFPLAAS
jgi:hypothetical protein